MTFEFATPQRIVFGPGAANQLPDFCARHGRRVLLVSGRSSRHPELLAPLARGFELVRFSVPAEPTVDLVQQGAMLCRERACESVVGLGGGSVMDAAKAIAVLAANEGDILNYLEVVGRGESLPRPGVPCVAIPTTAGTGAEVTRNSVLHSEAHRVKVSLRGPHLLPRLALVDPNLTEGLPSQLAAQTGMDALTQLIEPFVSGRANPMTDGFCREGLGRLARSLKTVVAAPTAAAREDVSLAALLSGLSLANAGLGAVHGFAGPIGGMFPAPHGAVCAALLPSVMLANIEHLQAHSNRPDRLARFDEIGRILTGRPESTWREAIEWVVEISRSFRIPTLRTWGVRESEFGEVVRRAQASSSMKANPVVLPEQTLARILEKSY